MIKFLMNCFMLAAGLLFLGGSVLLIKKLSRKTISLLLLCIAGLVQVLYWFAPSGFVENSFLENGNLLFITLIIMIIDMIIGFREKMAVGFRQITQWLKRKFTHETI